MQSALIGFSNIFVIRYMNLFDPPLLRGSVSRSPG